MKMKIFEGWDLHGIIVYFGSLALMIVAMGVLNSKIEERRPAGWQIVEQINLGNK